MSTIGTDTTRARVLTAGSVYTESPRWHDGRLWYLDVGTSSLKTVDLEGNSELVEKFDQRPHAIDFLPDGTLLVALDSRQIMRLDDHEVYADLSELTNDGRAFDGLVDMVIDGQGRAYVGCAMGGRDYSQRSEDLGDAIAVVDPDGSVRIGAVGVYSPNGLAITADGAQLIVAEPWLSRLAGFDIVANGSLGRRRVVAELGEDMPDGICVDAESAIWVGAMAARQALRVDAQGRIAGTVTLDEGHWAIATMLGGPEGRHLFIASCHLPTGQLRSWEDARQAQAAIQVAEVGVERGGWPSN